MNTTNPPIANHIAAIPLFYWRGAHPFPLTLTADDTGDASILVLGREGDICLMPLAWEQNIPAPFDSHPRAFHADALDKTAINLTLHDLQSDGWQINGRLQLHFTGHETTTDFWQQTEAPLRKTS